MGEVGDGGGVIKSDVHSFQFFHDVPAAGEFSPLTWPACSLTTVADVAILTVFNFILPALGEWQEFDIWCH